MTKSWARELIEDAAGLLCLGTPMLFALDNALRSAYATDHEQVSPDEQPDHRLRIYAVDNEHPPVEMRLAFAKSLLRQRDQPGQPDSDTPAGIDELAALVWARKSEIVALPLNADQDMIDVLSAVKEGSDLDAWRKGQINIDAEGVRASLPARVRRASASAGSLPNRASAASWVSSPEARPARMAASAAALPCCSLDSRPIRQVSRSLATLSGI